ncbi:hypothetical protein [Cohnella thailandensis]|uniref:Uncharacterized protein n=1 Tax=Cohnella thailandensis TaxID=557557 RepID=A0A841SRH1_9BACL|nr:hypothetical protein [Cohnella thailandensis]MBB6632768.1 hypothetical protein [Cohnella thailandensis]MBP1975543.1 hypothetical protein [Cohnella thailandensis]
MEELKQQIEQAIGIAPELRRLLIQIVDGVTTYNNTTSGLTATTVQGAIDELAAASAGA